MTNGTDADFLQALLGEVGEDPLVILLSRKATSYLDHDVHDCAPNSGLPPIIVRR